MDYSISNGVIEAIISDKGAELKSLKLCDNCEEFIWGADASYWGKSSPVLFPFVGIIKENVYTYKNKSYKMDSRHGFARDRKFQVAEKSEGMVSFKLSWDEASMKIYPFKFEFYILYSLESSELKITYLIKNMDEEEMYFSLGAHPAFSIPVDKDTELNDYYLEFESIENAEAFVLENNLVAEKKQPFLEGTDVLFMKEDLFEKDAVIFEGLKSKRVSLKCRSKSRKVTVDYGDFRYIAFWNVPGAHFVCIEPWLGITDFYNSDGRLENKTGIQRLKGNENFEAVLKIAVEA